jgi:hypothetical protein
MALNSLGNRIVVASSTPADSPSAPVDKANLQDSLPQDLSEVSPPGLLYSQLEQLQQSNPAEFKQVVALIAETLQKAASQQGAPEQVQAMASAFQQASQTGEMPKLGVGSQPVEAIPPAYAAQVQSSTVSLAALVQSAVASALQTSRFSQ